MKKTIVLAVMLTVFCNFIFAQSEKYLPAMKANAEKARTSSTSSSMRDLANSYERIAKAVKTQWLPYYYSALYNLASSFTDSLADTKLAALSQAKVNLEEGIKLAPQESELLVIKVMALFSEMSIAPQNAMSLFPQVQPLIAQAKALNPENPRIYLTEGQGVYYTPVQFGGGKERALPILNTAMEKFNKFVPVSEISPNWGKDQCEQLMK